MRIHNQWLHIHIMTACILWDKESVVLGQLFFLFWCSSKTLKKLNKRNKNIKKWSYNLNPLTYNVRWHEVVLNIIGNITFILLMFFLCNGMLRIYMSIIGFRHIFTPNSMFIYIHVVRLFFRNAYCTHQKALHLFYKLHYLRKKNIFFSRNG